MADMTYYPAANDKAIVGRFEYLDLIDIPASKERDEKVTRKIIVLRHKVAASTDDTVTKLKPENQDELISRFPAAWAAFEGKDPIVSGTPLSEMGYGEDEILRLRLQGLLTVEGMADLSDAVAQGLGFGYRKKRDDAKAWLEKKKQDAIAQMMAPPPPPPPEPFLSQQPGESLEDFADRIAQLAGKAPKNRGGRPPGAKNKPKSEAA